MNKSTLLMIGSGTKNDAIEVARAAGLLAARASLVVKGVASRGGGPNWGVEAMVLVKAGLDEADLAIKSLIPVDHAGNYDDSILVRTTTLGEACQLASRLGIRQAVDNAINAVYAADESSGRRKAFRKACLANDGKTLPTCAVPIENADRKSVV